MVTFDYNKLYDLAKEANNAAKEASTYADDLDKKVKNKISSYSGKHTGNINTAYDKVRLKSSQLRQKSSALTSYSGKVSAFRNTVMNAENRLTGRISSLMGDFKRRWNISEPGPVESFLEWLCDSLGLGDLFDDFKSFMTSLRTKIKKFIDGVRDWFHFDGGAELIDAIVAIVVAIVIVVIDVVLIFFTGGAWLAVKIVVAVLVAAIAAFNAYAKIRQYQKTFNKQHALHKSANNKIASETDYASWLRRRGEYEAAAAFQVAEFVVAVADLMLNVAEFGKHMKDIIKAEGRTFKTIAQSMKDGWAKYWKKGAKGTLKRTKDFVKIINGTYSMLRTNNFGKTGGKAFLDTIKAGKDTWDTLIKIGLDNIWSFEYFDNEVDPVTQIEKTGQQNMIDIVNKYFKSGVSAFNKIAEYNNHKQLNLDKFSYDSKISKQTDKIWKGFSAIGSPTKVITGIGDWLGIGSESTATANSASFQLGPGWRLPVLGCPIVPVGGFGGGGGAW